MTTRVSDISLNRTLLDAALETTSAYSTLQVKISTGEKYLSRSENPLDTDQAASIKIDLTKNEQFISNVESVVDWEIATCSALENVSEALQEANEAIIEMNAGTLDTDDYENIAAQVNEILETLLSASNTSYVGTEIFAGMNSGSDPYTATRDSDGNITAVTFLDGSTDGTRRKVATSSSATSSYGLTGDEVFEFEHYENTGTEASPNWQYVEVDIFQTLIDIRDDLESGTLPSDTLCERVQAAVDNVAKNIVQNASSQNKYESILDNLEGLTESATNRYSELVDLDLAEATVEYSALQTALEASYQLLSSVNSMSLIDYL
jgi:flagellin-like hook-associated protein FlgL